MSGMNIKKYNVKYHDALPGLILRRVSPSLNNSSNSAYFI